MYEFPLSFLTQNLYQDFFGFLDRYDCAVLLTVNKAIAEDVSKYVAVTPFATRLYYATHYISNITTKGVMRLHNPVKSMTKHCTFEYDSYDINFRNPKCYYSIWAIYEFSVLPGEVLSVKSEKEADNILYDFVAFKKHQAFREKRAFENQEELVQKTIQVHWFNGTTSINPPRRQSISA
jgi:hypothetical protein